MRTNSESYCLCCSQLCTTWYPDIGQAHLWQLYIILQSRIKPGCRFSVPKAFFGFSELKHFDHKLNSPILALDKGISKFSTAGPLPKTNWTSSPSGATQLKCLAAVWMLEKLHCYLNGAQFSVVTDCSALRSLLMAK